MSTDLQLFILQKALPTLFVFWVGACVGSLISVLVSRLPKGEDVVLKPSYCPKCNERLRWYDNVPIIGWVKLGGKCRFCKAPISRTYPMLELGVGLLFALIWMQCYWMADSYTLWGLELGRLTPDWARSGWEQTWPLYAVVVACFSTLLAMTLIDAGTYMIPLQLPWAAALIGLVIHTLWALGVSHWWGGEGLRWTADHSQGVIGKWWWSIPTPTADMLVPGWALPSAPAGSHYVNYNQWWWVGASIGGTVGIGVSLLLMRMGWIRQSFEDYEAWEKVQLEMQAKEATAAAPAGAAVAEVEAPDDPTELWVAYPHARREMIREMAFVAAPVLLALAGGYLAYLWTAELRTGLAPAADAGFELPSHQVTHLPLWLRVMSGVLMGYLLAGGTLWLIRILGTLGFGKEALGMGDIHLMAGVGACLGYIDAILAFFLSAPVALIGWIIGWVIARSTGNRKGTTLPYGPWLSLAVLLVFVFKPLIEWGFTVLLAAKPPINWP